MGRSIKDITTSSNTDWWKEFEETDKDLKWKVRSGIIASKVLLYLKRKDSMDRAALSEKLEISVQRLSKILKGKENLTLKSMTRLEDCTGLELINVLGEEVINEHPIVESSVYEAKTENDNFVFCVFDKVTPKVSARKESSYTGSADASPWHSNERQVA